MAKGLSNAETRIRTYDRLVAEDEDFIKLTIPYIREDAYLTLQNSHHPYNVKDYFEREGLPNLTRMMEWYIVVGTTFETYTILKGFIQGCVDVNLEGITAAEIRAGETQYPWIDLMDLPEVEIAGGPLFDEE